jgi:hypothetical protein
MSDAEKLLLRNDLSVINADRTNVNLAVPGPYTNDADAYANGVGYGEMYRKPDGTLTWIFEDIDAQLYIAAVQAALGTTIELALPSATNPRKILSDFYRAEKDAGRYSLHKRIFLPIYNNLAANAVDAITRTNGEFVGVPTTAMGYVKGNGTSQYFRTGFIPSSNFANAQNASIGWLAVNAATSGTRAHLGSQNSTTESLSSVCVSGTTLRFDCGNNSQSTQILAVADQVGIVIATSFAGRVRQEQRRQSGFSTLADNLLIAPGTLPNIEMYCMARNLDGTMTLPSDAGYGSWFMNTGMSASNAVGFTANLKTLWENLTGLTLP